MEKCTICLIRDMAEKTDLQKLIREALDRLPEKDKAGEALYEERLSVCRSCPHLLAGTCLKCGCYVEIRAASRSARCPMKNNKW